MRAVFTICFLVCFLFANTPAQQWVKVKPTFNSTKKLNTYHGFFSDENNGWWVTLYPGTILHTTNKGIDWETQVDSCSAAIGGITFIDSSYGWLYGETLPTPSRSYFILSTKDGGKVWNRYDTPLFRCFVFFDSLTGFAGGSDNIYKTTDGGINWDTMSIQTHVGKIGVYDIFFINKKNGWAVGGGGMFADLGFILNTVDSGKTWQFNDTLTNINRAVTFTDSLHGYTVGANPPYNGGIIKVTSNGGISWVSHKLPCSWLFDVVFTNDSSGWAVGEYGHIWKTTDRGIHWTQSESGTTSDLYRIFFFNNGKIGYILGADSTLLKYDNTVSIQDEHPEGITSYQIFQNYPNPFNPVTTITYQLPKSGSVTLKIFDILGNKVKTVVNEQKEIGRYNIQFDASSLASGMYVYQLRVNEYISTKKMLLVK